MDEKITEKVNETAEKAKDKKPRWITKVAHDTKDSFRDTKESLKKNKGKIVLAAAAAVPIFGGALVAWKLANSNTEEPFVQDATMVGPDADVLAVDAVTEA